MPFTDQFTVRRMSDIVAKRPKKSNFLCRLLFALANARIQSEQGVVIDIKKGGKTLAPLVSTLSGNPVMSKDSFSRLKFDLPIIGAAIETKAADMFKIREGMPDITTADILDVFNTIRDDTATVDDAITRTEEYMASQALMTGKVTLTGKYAGGAEVSFELDFQRDPELTQILSGTDQWGNTGVSAFNSMRSFARLIAGKGSVSTNHVVMGDEAADLLLSDTDVLKKLDTRNANFGQLAPQELDSDTMYHGYLSGIGHIFEYNATYTNASGVDTRYIPSRGVGFFSDKADNRMYYGGMAVNENDVVRMVRGARIVCHNITKRPPIVETLDVNSLPLTALLEPDTTGYMEV